MFWVKTKQKALAFNDENAGIENKEARQTVCNLVLYPDEELKNKALPDLNFRHTPTVSIIIFTAVIVVMIFAILVVSSFIIFNHFCEDHPFFPFCKNHIMF
jgi:hypothetical protein